MFALRSSEGEFSAGTMVEGLAALRTGEVVVRTASKVQKYRTTSRWDQNHTKQVHTRIEDGPAKPVEFVTTEDNLVKLRKRTR